MRADKKAEQYKFQGPKSNWSKADFEVDADHIFVSDRSGAVYSVNSLCDRYETASLKSLMKSVLAPLTDRRKVSERTFKFDGREALQSRLKAKVDGADVEVLATILRKDDCIFDFNLQGADPLHANDVKDYEATLNSFHYGKYQK